MDLNSNKNPKKIEGEISRDVYKGNHVVHNKLWGRENELQSPRTSGAPVAALQQISIAIRTETF